MKQIIVRGGRRSLISFTANALTIVFFAVSWFLSVRCSLSQSVPPQAMQDKVEQIVAQAAENYFKASPHAAGLSIGVLKDGCTFFYNYGTMLEGRHNPPSSNTLYPIASISKTFTGTLLAKAVLENKVRFDDDVRKYLDGSYPNLEYQGHPIELQYLVNHNSGLPFNLPNLPENRPPFAKPMSKETRQMLASYSRHDFLKDLHAVEIKTVPGQKFAYSNAAAVLLSIVLERVYKMPYEEIVKQKIASPLGMTNTTISLSGSQRRRLAKGYDGSGDLVEYPPKIMLGAAGLKSTAADLLKYASWELAENDPAVKLTHEPRFILTENYSLGLNWQITKSGDERRIAQDGSVPGFLSICATYPELDMAVVVLVNENDPASSKAFDGIARQIAQSLDPRSIPVL